jgi:predicted ester cyclase
VTGAIGDITVTIELLVSNGDLIANRNSARSVRKADGAEISWTEHEFWRADNGRLVVVPSSLDRSTDKARAQFSFV